MFDGIFFLSSIISQFHTFIPLQIKTLKFSAKIMSGRKVVLYNSKSDLALASSNHDNTIKVIIVLKVRATKLRSKNLGKTTKIIFTYEIVCTIIQKYVKLFS